VVVGTGLVMAVYAGVRTWGDRPQPSITITPKRGALVTVTVRASGLRSRDHLVVRVEQLSRAGTPGQELYGASLGPDAAGDVEEAVDVPLPAGDFDDIGARAWVGDQPRDCYRDETSTGGVRVPLSRT